MSQKRTARRQRSSPILFDEHGIVVRRDPDRSTGRFIVVGGMESSYVDIAEPTHLEFTYLRRIRDALDVAFPPATPLDIAHLGGAGCTLARHLAAVRPATRNEVFELDPNVAEVARRLLGVRNNPPRFRLRVGDARAAIEAKPDACLDVVVGDAFVDGLVPVPLATLEFAGQIARVLRPGGLYALNVVDAPPQRITRRITATLLEVFAEVTRIAPNPVARGRALGNLVFICTAAPLALDPVRVRAARDGEAVELAGRAELTAYASGVRPMRDGDGWLGRASTRRPITSTVDGRPDPG